MPKKVVDMRGRKSGLSPAIARSPYGAVLRPLEGQVLWLSKNLDIADHHWRTARELAEDLGATVVRRWTKDVTVTHVVVPRAEYRSWSTKVASTNKAGIPVVRALWLVECDRDQKFVAINTHVWETVLDEEEKLEAAREPYQAAQRKHDGTESNDQSRRPGRADDAQDGSLGPCRAKRGGNKGKKDEEKLKKNDAVVVAADKQFKGEDFKVYVDPSSGAIYDATLNKTDAENNSNKYYITQLLHNPVTNMFYVWTRWGRVGEIGMGRRLGDGTLEDAITLFQNKFEAKSGLSWENRGDRPRKAKYVLIERRIEGDDGAEDEEADNSPTEEVERVCGVEPECTLETPVRDLMELIFNADNMKATMAQLNYNSNKYPLGKLAKSTINLGFEQLKDLSAVLDDATLADSKYHLTFDAAVNLLTNNYYSLIPHDFGRKKPTIIRDEEILQREIQLLESLSGMKIAEELMKASQIGRKHHLDRKFQRLHLREMTPLLRETKEFKLLEQYLRGTVGRTHACEYHVVGIFRIEREGERKRFAEFVDSTASKSDRRLLWHGSRSTNYAGILSQGLRIAPSGAPASGYMFGKGIYLADMSSKSAGYCFPTTSNGEGLLLLCETELCDPMLELKSASPDAAKAAKEGGYHSALGLGRVAPGKWTDGAKIHKSLRGVKMPDPFRGAANTGDSGRELQYNEYICYDESQVLLRYLFRVKMK